MRHLEECISLACCRDAASHQLYTPEMSIKGLHCRAIHLACLYHISMVLPFRAHCGARYTVASNRLIHGAKGRLALANCDYAIWHMSGVKGLHSDCAPEHTVTSIPVVPKVTDKSSLKPLARVLYSTSERSASSTSSLLDVRYLAARSPKKHTLSANGRGGRAMDSTID